MTIISSIISIISSKLPANKFDESSKKKINLGFKNLQKKQKQ